MKRKQYIQRMSELGYSQEIAESLIRLSEDASDVALRINNFVPTADGRYEIWISGDRDDFFRVSNSDGRIFHGALGEAYEYVFEETRQWKEAQARAQDDS